MASSLQGLIVQPRSPENRKIAKTDNIKYEEHDDGFLYKMLDEKDWKKYRILNEQEEFEELSKSREIKESMYTMSGKFKDGKYVTDDKSKSGLKFVPPMFGTTSRSAKAAKKAWESDMAAGLDADSSVSLKTKGAKFQNTILELAKNSQANAEHKDRSDDDEEEFRYRKHHPTQSEYDNSANPNSQLFDVVNTMKNKYEQNLFVVEKLYNEKQAMERYIQDLESEVRASRGEPRRFPESYYENYPEPQYPYNRSSNQRDSEEEKEEFRSFKKHMRETYGSEQPPYSEYDHKPSHLKHSEYDPEEEESKHDSRRYSTGGRISIDDFHSSGNSRRPSSASYRGTIASAAAAAGASGRPQRSQSAPRGGRSSNNNNNSSSNGGPARYSAAMMSSMDAEFYQDRSDPCSVRTSSALRRSTGGLSTQLQADADRYVQKRRMLEEKERMEELAEKKRLQEQKERLLKASKSGKQFTEMLERQQLAEENAKARQEMQRQKELEEKKRQYEERQKQAIQKQKLLDEAIKNAPSWQQIQTLEEERRRERVERRKQELSLLMGSSGGQSGLMAPRKDSTAAAAAAATQTFTYRAKDPAEVAKALAEQKKARDQLLEEQRRKQKERQIAVQEAAESVKSKTTLELRKEIYDEKYRKRQELKAEKELEAKKAKEAAERRKHRQLMNMHVPIGKNTKSMELKAEKIKMDLERQKAEDRKHALLLKKKALSEKETAAVVRSLVKEREMERLGSHAGYSEINNTDAVIAAKAAAARREYKEQLRANQRKLEESLKSRPSLLERHDKKIVGKEAAKDANKKFKEIVKSSGIAEKDDIYSKLGLDEDF